jgi:prepilin-type N-terminal cleavage/methylation domain-containing protein
MISPSFRRQQGFTLVELLVVISIIAVLAAAGFGAGNAAIQKAKKVTCLATCTAIEAAVNNFYTEYGYMPKDLSDDPAVPLNTKNDVEFLNVLLGLTETGATPLNTRAIKFLTVKEGKARKNGLIYSTTGTSVIGLFDPWGGPYYVMLDGNYDEKIKVKPAAASAETTRNGCRVAVWSNGADCINGIGGKMADDVKTW